MSKQTQKIAFQFACFEKLLYLRHAPFPYRGGFLAGARLVLTQSSLRKYVRVLRDICDLLECSKHRIFFAVCLVSLSCWLLKSLSFTYVSMSPVKTVVSAWGSGRKGALGAPVFEGLHTPRSVHRLFNNREIIFRPTKKMRKNLHICNFCSIFAAKIENYAIK